MTDREAEDGGGMDAPEESVYVGTRTAFYRDDYMWAVRQAEKHGVPVDTIFRTALSFLRALVIAEITSIASLRSSGMEDIADAARPADGRGGGLEG